MVKTCLFAAVLCSAAMKADPLQEANQQADCEAVYKLAGVSKRFPGVVAHGVHSISVDDLKVFEPSANVDNIVPTVNLNLHSDPAILSNAPDDRSNSSFKTPGMRAVDKVLSHIDEKAYDIKLYSPLERLVHALHMQEVWANALPHYQSLKSTPPSDPRLCPCVKNVEDNGVMKMLRFIALKVREPELMYGVHTTLNNGAVDWSGNLYSYAFFPLSDEAIDLSRPEEVIPPLTNEAGWNHWKELMMGMKASDDYELAVFLYCALNE